MHLAGVASTLSSLFPSGQDALTIFGESELLQAVCLRFYWWDTLGAALANQRPILPDNLFFALLEVVKSGIGGSRGESATFTEVGVTEDLWMLIRSTLAGDVRSPEDVMAKARVLDETVESLVRRGSDGE